MSKLLKAMLVLALAVGFFGVYRYGAAKQAESDKGRAHDIPPTFDVRIPDVLATKHVLQGSYNNNGDYGSTVSVSTYTPIDSQLTVSCPGTSGTCTIQLDAWIENGEGSASANQNNICLYVDGVANGGNSGCGFFAGQTPSDGSWVNSSNSISVSGIALGNHTVQTYFKSFYGAYVAHYDTNYRVYKP
jgi:hypothetical protein